MTAKKLDVHENCNKRTPHRNKRANDLSYVAAVGALTIKNHPSAMHIDRERNPEEKRVGIQRTFQRLKHYVHLQRT